MWFWNSGIPGAAHDMLDALPSAPTAFAMDDSGWWICVDTTGTLHTAADNDFSAEVARQLATGNTIEALAISPDGTRWAISTDAGGSSFGLETAAQDALGGADGAGPTQCIAINNAGGIAVLTPMFFEARGIDDACYQTIRNMRQHGNVDVVQFTSSDGWVVVDGAAVVARNLDQGCLDQIGSFVGNGDAITTVAFTNGGSSWSVMIDGTIPAAPPIPLRVAERAVDGQTIWQGMAAAGAPGVSIAVVDGNTVTTSAGYGWLTVDGSAAAHPESVFQAASISKLVNALGVLRLVDDGAFKLNDDARPFLNWDLGQRFSPDVNRVTFRQLLRHSSGVIGAGSTVSTSVTGPDGQQAQLWSRDGGGFNGYLAGNPLPTLIDILDGTAPANSPKVELSREPNTSFSYSGAGTMVLQRAIEEITGTPYATWMTEQVLAPLAMTNSTFEIGPPDGFVAEDELAVGHFLANPDTTPATTVINGGRRNHPESAAAGLYTTALDLCRVIIMINQGGTIDGTSFLAPDLIDQMLKPSPYPVPPSVPRIGAQSQDFGLSCNLPMRSGNLCWSHGGSNSGFRCKIFGVPAANAGVVVMTNGSSNGFMNDVVDSLLAAHGW